METSAMFSSSTDNWATPQYFFDKLDDEFIFTLDPCADDQNHKCFKYFTKEQDGLAQDWSGERVFCNPPHGKVIKKWVEKCFKEVYAGNAQIAVMLLPARTDTRWFHDFIYHKAEVRFIQGRLKFGESLNSAPVPSMVVIFRGNRG